MTGTTNDSIVWIDPTISSSDPIMSTLFADMMQHNVDIMYALLSGTIGFVYGFLTKTFVLKSPVFFLSDQEVAYWEFAISCLIIYYIIKFLFKRMIASYREPIGEYGDFGINNSVEDFTYSNHK